MNVSAHLKNKELVLLQQLTTATCPLDILLAQTAFNLHAVLVLTEPFSDMVRT